VRLLVAVLACSACAPAPPPPAPAGPPPVELTITPSTGDVWAWSVDVRGRAKASLATCRVLVAGKEQPARAEGATFHAAIRLSPGENVVEARCTDAAGRTIRSELARFDARLRPVPHARIETSAAGDALVLDGTKSARDASSGASIVAFRWSDADKMLSETPTLRVDATLLAKGERTITLEVRDARGQSDRARVLLDVESNDGRPPRSPAVVAVTDRASQVDHCPPFRSVRAAPVDAADVRVPKARGGRQAGRARGDQLPRSTDEADVARVERILVERSPRLQGHRGEERHGPVDAAPVGSRRAHAGVMTSRGARRQASNRGRAGTDESRAAPRRTASRR